MATKSPTKEDLFKKVEGIIFPNTTKAITATKHQALLLDIVESLWRDYGESLQGLQSVLDVGSFATIAAPFVLIANGNTFTLSNIGFSSAWENGSNNNGIIVSSLSNAIEISADDDDSGLKSNIKLNTQDISLEADGNGVVGGVLQTGASGTRIASKNNNQGNNNEISIIGDPNPLLGYKVSREYAPTNDATALWDIAGTLRVRDLPFSTEDVFLIVDTNGNVKKKVFNFIEKTVLTVANASAVTIDSSQLKGFSLTALTEANININAPTNSTEGDRVFYRIASTLSGRTISFNSIFREIGSVLPTSITANKVLYFETIYDATADRWDVIQVSEEV